MSLQDSMIIVNGLLEEENTELYDMQKILFYSYLRYQPIPKTNNPFNGFVIRTVLPYKLSIDAKHKFPFIHLHHFILLSHPSPKTNVNPRSPFITRK